MFTSLVCNKWLADRPSYAIAKRSPPADHVFATRTLTTGVLEKCVLANYYLLRSCQLFVANYKDSLSRSWVFGELDNNSMK